MKRHEIEAKALKIIKQVELGQPNEDSMVELKSTWIEAKKVARLIAGHANASGGEPILWLIGVDEKKGVVVGVDNQELANWYSQVKAEFNGLAPTLIKHINIPIEDKTIEALLFETDRAPYVVKNSAYGLAGGGSVQLEVPWREATGIRSATRSDLIKILSPLQKLPSFEVIKSEIHIAKTQEWIFRLELYVEPNNENGKMVCIPLHRCSMFFEIEGYLDRTNLPKISITDGDGEGLLIVANSQVMFSLPVKMIISTSILLTSHQPSMFRDKEVLLTTYLKPFKSEPPICIESKIIPLLV